MNRFPESMRMIGLVPGFSRAEWDIVMSVERPTIVRVLAYQEWLTEQDEKYDGGNWRWHLSYLHGTGIIPIERPESPQSSMELSRSEKRRELLNHLPTPPSS